MLEPDQQDMETTEAKATDQGTNQENQSIDLEGVAVLGGTFDYVGD